MKPGYHVASNVAPNISVEGHAARQRPAAELQNVALSNAEIPQLAGETLSVFDGDIRLKLTLKVAPNAPVGRTMMTSKVSYQACDDRVCLRPDYDRIKVPLDIRN